jgi:hypothetical protein
MKKKNNLLYVYILATLLLTVGIVSCDQSSPVLLQKEISHSSALLEQELFIHKEEKQTPLFITYHLDSIETAASIDSFKLRFTENQQEFIFALNRMDAYRLKPGKMLVIPDTLTTNFMDYSPFPAHLEMLDSIPKAVLISRRIQAFALFEQGGLIHWGPVSSGKKSTPTPAGLFYGNYKALRKISTVNDSWIMPYYFNYMNFEGVGVHQYTMPGYPASHACVRLRKEDAQMIYDWALQWKLDKTGQVILQNGTPFMVYGDYDFEGQVPWLELAQNPNSNYLTAQEMKILKDYTLQYKKDKRNFEPSPLPATLPGISTEDVLDAVQ